jgi:hypothetical protein
MRTLIGTFVSDTRSLVSVNEDGRSIVLTTIAGFWMMKRGV